VNEHAPTEVKSDVLKYSFCEKLEQVFEDFPKYRTDILSDFIAKFGRADIFKQTIGIKSLHQDSNDNGVRIVNFATSNHRVVKNLVFPHRNIHEYTWTSSGGKTHNQTDHELVDRDDI